MDKVELQKNIGSRIKIIRESKKISQQDFAALCNFEKSNFNRIESGGTNPTIYTLWLIAENLEISLSELVNF